MFNKAKYPCKNLHLLVKFYAFSLVEILVALIIISIIIAALSPVITKKLSSSTVTLGSSDAISDITTDCQNNENFSDKCELCTSNICIKCEISSCPVGQYLDNKKCECKSCTEKYGELCSECNSTSCTKCNNSSYYINNGTCSPCPAGSYCDGSKVYATCPGDGYYCDSTGIHKCSDKHSVYCLECNSNKCTLCQARYFPKNSECLDCPSGCEHCTSANYCTECVPGYVLDSASHTCPKKCSSVMTGCRECLNASVCTECSGEYYLNTAKTCTSCTVSNCIKCKDGQSASKPACELCTGGYYLNSSGTCSTCSFKFGSNCVSCASDRCLSCIQGYHLKNATSSEPCEVDDKKFSCSDSNFMQIDKLCMTRRNMGDSISLTIPSTVTVVDAEGGEICYSANQKCCWSGFTSLQDKCDSVNGDYSGCNRTVCNWEAAKEICSKFTFGGKSWRLPTDEDLKNVAYVYSIGVKANGLMFCQQQQSSNSTWCISAGNKCPGSYNGCVPDSIWGDAQYDNLHALNYWLTTGIWRSGDGHAYRAFSVRCVADMD